MGDWGRGKAGPPSALFYIVPLLTLPLLPFGSDGFTSNRSDTHRQESNLRSLESPPAPYPLSYCVYPGLQPGPCAVVHALLLNTLSSGDRI